VGEQEPDDFASFVDAGSSALLRTAYLLTGDRVRARDAVQSALLAAHRHWDQVADPPAYVRRELVRAVTGQGARVRVADVLADSPLLAGAWGLPGFARRAADPGPQDRTTTALAGLPARERAAVVLRFGDALPDGAVADALGCPAEDVAPLVAAALGRLDAGTAERLRTDLAGWSDPVAPSGDTYAEVLDGARDQHRHRAGLVALAGFVVLVVLLVALTV
jgi:DNA-directed RNA polymerase specialized sigma24 family protein